MKTEVIVSGNSKYFLKRRLFYFDWSDAKTRKEHTESFEKGKQAVKYTILWKLKGFFLRGDLLQLGVKLKG